MPKVQKPLVCNDKVINGKPSANALCSCATKAERQRIPGGDGSYDKCMAAARDVNDIIKGKKTTDEALAAIPKPTPPPADVTDPAAILEKVSKAVGSGAPVDPADLPKITTEFITTKANATQKDAIRSILKALDPNSSEAKRIATALGDVKEPVKPANDLDLGSHGGWFAEAGYGLALTSSTYYDSVNPAGSLGGDAIRTGSYGVGKKPSGNYPGHRFDLSAGYAIPVQNGLNVRVGAHVRFSSIQQGYENPQFGRSVPDMSQFSAMALVGIEKYITPDFAIFADARFGITSNSFPSGTTGNLQTSAQATQYADLKSMEGVFLSGGAQAGAAYRLIGPLSVFAALGIYGDATKATAKTDGGGNLEYGTTGVELSGTVGLKVSK